MNRKALLHMMCFVQPERSLQQLCSKGPQNMNPVTTTITNNLDQVLFKQDLVYKENYSWFSLHLTTVISRLTFDQK